MDFPIKIRKILLYLGHDRCFCRPSPPRWRPSWSFHPFLGVRFWLTVIHYMSSRTENRYKPFVKVLGGEVVYKPVYIVVLTFWRPSWTPSWILEKAQAGITGSFSMLFLMVFGRFPEKFSLGIFFSPSKPNTIRLFDGVLWPHHYVGRAWKPKGDTKLMNIL